VRWKTLKHNKLPLISLIVSIISGFICLACMFATIEIKGFNLQAFSFGMLFICFAIYVASSDYMK